MMDKRYLDQAFFFCFPETKINRSILFLGTSIRQQSWTIFQPTGNLSFLFAACLPPRKGTLNALFVFFC